MAACKLAKIELIGYNQLRHSVATHLAKKVSPWLSSRQTTNLVSNPGELLTAQLDAQATLHPCANFKMAKSGSISHFDERIALVTSQQKMEDSQSG